MAVVKISELPAMQTIAGSDILPIVDTSETETKKVTKQMLLTDIDASEVKIGDLSEATQINDADYLIINQSGTNKKISKANARFASGDEISIGTTQPSEEEKLWINSSLSTNQAKYKDGNTWKELSIKALDSMPIGSIIAFAGTTIPNGWLECNGSAVSRTTYADLFSTIGTSHGSGNGTTTFNIPNLKGKTIFGLNTNDLDFEAIGNDGGEKKHTLTTDEMPAHSHTQRVEWSNTSYDNSIAVTIANSKLVVDKGLTTGSAGGGQAHNNLPPYIVEKYIIKAFNVVPTMAGIVNADSTSSTDAYSCKYVNDKLEWKKGDSVTIGNGVGFGVTGGSGGAAYVSIPLSKPINSSVSSATITINAGSSVRYEGNEVTISSFTLGDMFKEAGTIRIYTNNIQLPPHRIVGLFYNITITFS